MTEYNGSSIDHCVSCRDPIEAGVRAPCGHHYDAQCISDLFQAATRDESLFPPRCCRQPIPFADVRPHLTATLASLFEEKSKELGTLKRVYCTNPTCSHFLGAQKEGWRREIYTCPTQGCRTLTCSQCKAKVDTVWHVCNQDGTDQQVLALGRSAGWARCPGCEQMIELHTGCYHMTCVCKTQFCYLCKAIWKKCRCPQWDERRLFAAAEERVDNQLAAHRPQRAPAPVQPALNQPIGRPAVPHPPVTLQRQTPSPSTVVTGTRTLPPVTPQRQVPTIIYHNAPAPRNTSHSTSSPSTIVTGARTLSPVAPERQVPTTIYPHASAPRNVSHTTPSRSTVVTGARTATLSHQHSRSSYPTAQSNSSIYSANRAQMIQAAAADLRENHDCQHKNWRYRSLCQTCYHNLPLYFHESIT
jgi:hypothetical protein